MSAARFKSPWRATRSFTCVWISSGLPPEVGSFRSSSGCVSSWSPTLSFTVYVPGGMSTASRPIPGATRPVSGLGCTSGAYAGAVRRRATLVCSFFKSHQTRLIPTLLGPCSVRTVCPAASAIVIVTLSFGAVLSQ